MGNEVMYTLGEEIIEYYAEKKQYFLADSMALNSDETYKLNKCEEIIALIVLCYVLSENYVGRKNKYVRYSVNYLEMLISYLDSCSEYSVKQYGYTGLGYCLKRLSHENKKFKDFGVAVNEVVISMAKNLLEKRTETLTEDEIINLMVIAEYLMTNEEYERNGEVGDLAVKKLIEIYERRRVELSDSTLVKIIHSIVFKWGYKPSRFSKIYMLRDIDRISKKELSHEEVLMKVDIYSTINKGEDFRDIKLKELKKYKNQILNKWTDVEISYKDMLIFITSIIDNECTLRKLRGVS